MDMIMMAVVQDFSKNAKYYDVCLHILTRI